MSAKFRLRVVYTGRRLNGDRGFIQRFETPDGKERFFSGIHGVFIGHTYEAGATGMAVWPKRLDVERIDNPEWEAADALVEAKRRERSAEARVRKALTPALKTAIAALTPLMKDKGYFEREAIIKYLAEQTKARP